MATYLCGHVILIEQRIVGCLTKAEKRCKWRSHFCKALKVCVGKNVLLLLFFVVIFTIVVRTLISTSQLMTAERF